MSIMAVNLASNVEINFAAGTISLFNKAEAHLVKDAKILSYFRVGASRGIVVQPFEDSEAEAKFIIPEEIAIMHDPENYPEEWIYPRNKFEFSPGSWDSMVIMHIVDVNVHSVNGGEFDISFEGNGHLYPKVTCTGAMINGETLFFIPKRHRYEKPSLLMVYSLVAEQEKSLLEQLQVPDLVKTELLHRWKLKQEELDLSYTQVDNPEEAKADE
jgi:hypothetical protein